MLSQNLESLLLRHQATQASLKYIESLITKRIDDNSLVNNSSVDTTAELINLLNSFLYRAGSGLVQVIAYRVARGIVIPLLSKLQEASYGEDDIFEAILHLLESNPIILECCEGAFLDEVTILMSKRLVPSPAILGLSSLALEIVDVTEEFARLVVSKAIGLLACARDSRIATACLHTLLLSQDLILRDPQIVNSVIGVAKCARSEFNEDIEIRRLCSKIENLTSGDHSIFDHILYQPPPTKPFTEVCNQDTAFVESHLPDHITQFPEDRDHSPMSSCPSLDL
jgi:hypothetical protein